MEEKFTFPTALKYFSLGLVLIGVIAVVVAFIGDAERAWANILLNNYFFLSIAIGASFFFAIQYISQSGWSAAFKRIPESLTFYIPVAAIIMIVGILGMKYLYPWINPEEVPGFDAHDLHLIDHKSPYLNMPFFIIRLVIYFLIWIALTQLLRRFSVKEDLEGGMTYFRKSEYYSKIYIFTLALTFTLASIDWIMSLEPTWFSTLFAVKNFASAFYHGSAVIILMAVMLNSMGYLSFMNKAHWHDFSKYLFFLSIVFGYMWYAQYMLIWYANIPEETIYYITRRQDFSQTHFILNVVLNWAIPFVVLLPNFLAKNKYVLAGIAVVLIIGHYVDLFEQIIPGAMGEYQIGFTEIGMWLGFLGLFIYVVARALSWANLVPKNHPYIEESLHHSAH